MLKSPNVMKKTFSDAKIAALFDYEQSAIRNPQSQIRNPVHVVYGGANLFTAETPEKLGKIALKSLKTYAPNFAGFARAMWLKSAETLPIDADEVKEIEFQLIENEAKVREKNFAAWFAWTIYNRTIAKLKREPIEDFRIDFEDGYGFRTDAEEDSHCISASNELAKISLPPAEENSYVLPFCGFRIKSFAPETHKRAVRTLDLFLTNLLEKCGGKLPENFVVTLPKITRKEEIEILVALLDEFESTNNLENGALKIEIMLETPQSIVNERGEIALQSLVKAGKGRVNSAHFGVYDYTASFGISGVHQHLRHEACNFARQMMQISLAPLNIRLSDSVTTEIPVAIHKGENLTKKQLQENAAAIHKAWRTHFNNVTYSQINGFYQSWDLHPAQFVARYAAVYAFFLESAEVQKKRLKGFIEKATQANMTGNTFDDAASAQGLLNFFIRALNCGAMTEAEILEGTNLSADELKSASFAKIMDKY
jgi:HpcH/HpaI aldolase/citrate lyase family